MHPIARVAALSVVVATLSACHRPPTDPAPTLIGCHDTPAPAAVSTTHPAGTLSARASGLTGRPYGISVSSTGVVLVTQQDANSVARFTLVDPVSRVSVPTGGDPGDVVFSHDGRTAYVSNFFDGTVRVVDVPNGQGLRLLTVDPFNAYRLAISPDDTQLYVTSTSGRLYLVDPSGRQPTLSVQLAGSLQGIALSRDGLTLMASSTSGAVYRLNACTLATLATTQLTSSAQDIALAADQTELYVASESGRVDVLDVASLNRLRGLSFVSLRPFGLAVTPDGTRLYVTSPTTGQVAIIDRGSGTMLRTLATGGTPRRIAFDATGSTAVVSNEGNWVDVIR